MNPAIVIKNRTILKIAISLQFQSWYANTKRPAQVISKYPKMQANTKKVPRDIAKK